MPRPSIISTVLLVVYLNYPCADIGRAALIAEVATNVSGFDGSPPASELMQYSFSVASLFPTLISADFVRQISAADIGSTFEAEPGVVESFAQGLTRPEADVTIRLHRISNSRPLDQLQEGAWAECCEIVTFRKFVPDITKVHVTQLTMTIDSFYFERFGRNANYAGAHTIRIYGVPEPGTSILCCIGSLIGLRRSRC